MAQAKKVLSRYAQKKENKERLANALHVLQSLEDNIKAITKTGTQLVEIVKNANEQLGQNDAEQLYSKLPDLLDNVRGTYSSFTELCREASVLSQTQFMEEVRKTDSKTYGVISFIGKFYHDGKLDIRDLPMFISLYGPHGKEAKQYQKQTDEKLTEIQPVLSKVERLSKKLPPPVIRGTQSRLRRSLLQLAKQKESIEKIDDGIVDQLLSQSPEWMQSLNKIIQEARIGFNEQLKRKGFRISSVKRDTNLSIWPRRHERQTENG